MTILVGAVLVILLGMLVLWWARASQRGTLPRQWIFGYRTALTLSDKNAWITVHRATALYLYIAGFGSFFAGIVAAIISNTRFDAFASALLGGAIGWATVWVIVSFIPAVAAARKYKNSTCPEQ